MGKGIASICKVVILGNVNAFEVLSSSSIDPGDILPGLSPILTCAQDIVNKHNIIGNNVAFLFIKIVLLKNILIHFNPHRPTEIFEFFCFVIKTHHPC